ncbi:MAG: roadblock/LC7 domain-containing protein [Methylococcales bacterium]
MVVAMVIGLIAAAMLLLAGYIFGAKKGGQVRENLQKQLSYQQNEAIRLNTDTEKKIDALMQQSDTLHRVVEPLAEWESHVAKLDNVVKEMQSSASQRDKVALELTNLETTAQHRGDLTRLMDEITEKAHFETVLLSDENGLPVAANATAKDLDRLAAISSFVLVFGDRLTRDGGAAPLSLMVHDTENREMLCRIFHIGNQRFVLTAISIGLQLTSTALDPALSKVTRILSTENW